MQTPTPSHDSVRHYYGEVLQRSSDLKTGACCSPDALSPRLRALIADVHPEVRERFYGCGSPIPPALDGCTVLDLGCGSGSGRDCFVLSKLVGEAGRVIGIDMTPEQLSVARRHVGWHSERYGYAQPNVEFRETATQSILICATCSTAPCRAESRSPGTASAVPQDRDRAAAAR